MRRCRILSISELVSPGGDDLPVALNGKLDRGDRGLAHERAVEAVVGAQAVIEFGALLLAARFLLGRDRTAIGEARIGIEALREGSRRRQQACCKQGRREGLRVERRGAPSCRARDNHARKKASLALACPCSSAALSRHESRYWCQKNGRSARPAQRPKTFENRSVDRHSEEAAAGGPRRLAHADASFEARFARTSG